MTDLTELRRLVEAAERIEVQPEWTEADWDDHEAYIAALDPTTVLRLLDVVEAAEIHVNAPRLASDTHRHGPDGAAGLVRALDALKEADDA